MYPWIFIALLKTPSHPQTFSSSATVLGLDVGAVASMRDL